MAVPLGETSLGEFAGEVERPRLRSAAGARLPGALAMTPPMRKEQTACGTHGHAEGTRGAAAPVLQKWLRGVDKTGRPRNPAGRLLLLPSLPADDDPTQQT